MPFARVRPWQLPFTTVATPEIGLKPHRSRLEAEILKEVLLTPEGYEKLTQELEVLRTEKRREVADRIRVAREFGDIAENAEYDDAKNEQAMLEHKIAQLEERLLSARVIDVEDVDTSVVSVGLRRPAAGRRRQGDGEVPHRRVRRGQPGRVQALERIARRACHSRSQEG